MNNENHFAMVENFVEKYLPIGIQTQISNTLINMFSGATNVLEKL
jgi:hypothetical protein